MSGYVNRGTKPYDAVFKGILDSKIDLVTSVPCINLKELIHMVETSNDIIHVPVSREEEGVGICAGAYMGFKRTAILMQNSGLGNSINALASLNLLYGIPLLMIVSHRGTDEETISAQIPMGDLTPKLLDTIGIPYFITDSVIEVHDIIVDAWEKAELMRKPVAVLLPISFWRSI
ncbi:sulfopyruvate decarboxylase subunit alpha [Methanosalsum natronophilum]|uniref:sulfopyruvate decarboxylase subunit alpha n=1 Tax=Methanosalsum natronophilum TaxID=768733 RepID=UPI0021679E5F|nr:sulfopyruvate decarboxylase subunit alpha [Methanosalsum natronophilum]MCS3923622.1 sulfopyruvate decarboxylase subunit alpha [Methanosalsum natronophilum]